MDEITVFYEGPIVTPAVARAAGLKRYFTGRPCKLGHIAERSVANGDCYKCLLLRQARFRATEIGKKLKKERDAQYQRSPAGKASHREANIRYLKTPKGKEVMRLGQKKYRQSEHGNLRQRAYRAEYIRSEKGRASRRLADANRRARERDARGRLTHEDEQKLRSRQKSCHICGGRFTKADPPTMDHVIPLAKGGSNDLSNIALAHYLCNVRKRAERTHLI